MAVQQKGINMWIKKGEGSVPNRDTSILVHFENGSIETVHAQDFINGLCEFNCEITHWMPVPDAPELKDSDNTSTNRQCVPCHEKAIEFVLDCLPGNYVPTKSQAIEISNRIHDFYTAQHT